MNENLEMKLPLLLPNNEECNPQQIKDQIKEEEVKIDDRIIDEKSEEELESEDQSLSPFT